MERRPLLTVLALLVVASLLAWSMNYVYAPEKAPGDDDLRVVSLAPAITETLFEIGAQDSVVGASDYCRDPAQAEGLPRCGTALTPNFEAIVRLNAGLILTEDAVAAPREKLGSLGRVEFLKWLTLDDVVASTRRIGELTNRKAQADALADKLHAALSVKPAPDAPRVLLVMGGGDETLGDIFFIRRNSIHGTALEAAGARNAVADAIPGMPTLGVERVLELDPDAIIILDARDALPPQAREAALAAWRKLTVLRAVKEGRVRLLHGRTLFGNGPGVLTLVERLRAELAALFK